jgi:hypothetical protein
MRKAANVTAVTDATIWPCDLSDWSANRLQRTTTVKLRHPLTLIILSVIASSPAAPAAAIESPAASVARAIEFKPYPKPHITKAQWTTYYEQVQAAYGVSLQVVTEQRLNVFYGDGVA